jgi:hypothetical protein
MVQNRNLHKDALIINSTFSPFQQQIGEPNSVGLFIGYYQIRPIKINNLFYMGVRLDFQRRLDFFYNLYFCKRCFLIPQNKEKAPKIVRARSRHDGIYH